MRRTDYPAVIAESVSVLRARETASRGTAAAPRLQMLRLLKSGEARTLPQVAALVGFSARQVERWWQSYRDKGLTALERVYHPAGKRAQLTEAACSARGAISPRPGASDTRASTRSPISSNTAR